MIPGFSSWKLRHRILLLIFCVVTGTLASSLALVEFQVRNHLSQKVSQELQRSMTSFQQSDHEKGQALTLMVAALETQSRLRSLFLSRDDRRIVDFLRQSAQNYQVYLVTDDHGRLLLRTDYDESGHMKPGRDISSLGPIQLALADQRSQDYGWFDQGLWRLASTPLTLERNGLAGTLSVGYRAEQNLVERVSREFDCDTAVFSEGKLVSVNERCLLPASLLGEALAAQVRLLPPHSEGADWYEFDVHYTSTRYRAALAPLGTGPIPVAYIALLQNNREAVELVHQTRWLLGGLGVLALAAALLVSIPVVGRVANPAELIDTVLQTVGDGLIHVNQDWTINRVNLAAEKLLGCSAGDLLDSDFFRQVELGGPNQSSLDEAQLQSQILAGETVRYEDGWLKYRHGSSSFASAFVMAPVLQEGKPSGAVLLFRDISELKGMQRQLLSLSHQAGMAEVATGTLHNVGNALNSVSVSASLVADQLGRSKLPNLSKTVALLPAEPEALAAYLTEDPKGRKIVLYLSKLASHLEENQAATLGELHAMLGHLDHVKQVIKMQQAHTKTDRFCELVQISELLDGALAMSQASHPSPAGLKVVREYALDSAVNVEKHKLLQILVNLCSNALDALMADPKENKTLCLRTWAEGQRVFVEVEDSAMGIAPENLEKLFTHGFTTKPEGHGFGLHNSALAALSMEGRLSVRSPGEGQGATFLLELKGS